MHSVMDERYAHRPQHLPVAISAEYSGTPPPKPNVWLVAMKLSVSAITRRFILSSSGKAALDHMRAPGRE